MAANFRFIVHATEREPHELAAQRARNRLAQRSLAHARRPDEAQNRPLHVRLQPTNREIVENAVFDFLQIVVIRVENFLGLRNLDFLTRSLCPRQHGKPFNVVARERIVGGHRRHARQPAQFLQRFFLHFIGHARFFDFLLQIFDVALAFVLLTQFLLDRLHLLAQVILALRLLHAILHFALNLVAQLLDFEFLGQVLVDFFQPHVNIERLQRVLLVGRRQRRQRRGDEVHQAAGLVNVHGHGRKFIRQRRRTGDDLLEQRQHVALQSFDLRSRNRRRALGQCGVVARS